MDHTPGPWQVCKFQYMHEVIDYSGKRVIARLPDGYTDEDKANACLIAAAPDLLNALLALRDACSGSDDVQEAHEQFDEFLGAMKAADKAIAKTTGENE